jgi:hypothetical protein
MSVTGSPYPPLVSSRYTASPLYLYLEEYTPGQIQYTSDKMQAEGSRDKDYSFARLCDLKPNLTLKMYVQ